MPFGEYSNLSSHLEALRKVLLCIFAAMGLAIIPMLFIAPYFLNFLITFITAGNTIALNYFSPLEVFVLQIKIGFLLAAVLTSPYIIHKVWLFVLPALYEKEKKFFRYFIGFSALLFASGVFFCLFVIVPCLIKFGLSFSNAHLMPVWGISNIISLSVWLSIGFGIVFQMPLAVSSAINSGLVSYEAVSSKRSYIVIVLLIVSAVLTPPDIISQILMAGPAYILFEFGLLLSSGKKYKKIENEADIQD